MRRFGLIGFPLSHSFSPAFFADKFQREGITDAVYEAFPLANIEDLKQLLADNPGIVGLNVTIPYKKKVIRFLTEGNDAVKQTVACNCIKIKDGKLFGYNTDIIGFQKSLIPHLQPHHNKALILGTGGAAQAVEYVLKQLNISYVFVSRNKVGKANCINYSDVNESWMSIYKLVINTTPAGQFPNIGECPPLPYKYITNQHYFYDLLYNPAETLFLKQARQQGAIVKNGEEMLHLQAEESWKIWNDETK
ncbi:shikimate dehydrogenase [Aridibaculum aurantiacum]|uniref:shikimate dehydrogenase n=1 Tax=Aridibaculum aurantiacum TaxID=2810307 RepID=UPI001A95773F